MVLCLLPLPLTLLRFQGFLTCVFSKSSEIFFRHPHDGTRRTAKELFLNYAVFLFSLIGAVSIWMRMFSWVSFLHTAIGFWIVALSLIKVLDRRIFYYRYFISDEVLVSGLLILGFFITGVMVVLYLGTESYLEGSRAAMDLSNWIQTNFINDERKREIWSQQVENSRAMMSAAIRGVENNYNETMWWPPLKSLVKTYYLDAKTSDGNATTQASSFFSILSLPENMTLIEAVSLAYAKADSVNLTSVELSGWTSKGLEVSSMAVGSLAQVLLLVVTLLFAFVSMGIRAFFFISTLFYLLCTSWDPIERFVEDLLPISVEKRPQVVRSLRKVIEGVFFLPLKMSSIHAIVTLASFTIVVRTVLVIVKLALSLQSINADYFPVECRLFVSSDDIHVLHFHRADHSAVSRLRAVGDLDLDHVVVPQGDLTLWRAVLRIHNAGRHAVREEHRVAQFVRVCAQCGVRSVRVWL